MVCRVTTNGVPYKQRVAGSIPAAPREHSSFSSKVPRNPKDRLPAARMCRGLYK